MNFFVARSYQIPAGDIKSCLTWPFQSDISSFSNQEDFSLCFLMNPTSGENFLVIPIAVLRPLGVFPAPSQVSVTFKSNISFSKVLAILMKLMSSSGNSVLANSEIIERVSENDSSDIYVSAGKMGRIKFCWKSNCVGYF